MRFASKTPCAVNRRKVRLDHRAPSLSQGLVLGLGLLSACTRSTPKTATLGAATGTSGQPASAASNDKVRLPKLPAWSGDRLVARLTDLAGTAALDLGDRSLSDELAALDTPYKLVSPYSGLRGDAALRVLEVAVVRPQVTSYAAGAAGPGSSEPATRSVSTEPTPRFDPVWNRFRGVYESKLSLLAPQGGCYRYRMTLPAHGSLAFSVAAMPSKKGAGSVPVEFSLAVDGQSVWQQKVTATQAGRWLPFEVQLPAATSANRPQELSLCSRSATPGAGSVVGTAIWGNPELWALGEGAKAANVLLILVDTLRDDATTMMPRLGEFATQSVRFSQAITAATWTRPSLLALLGGELPSAIGQNAEDMIPKERDRQRFYALGRKLLPRVLRESGLKVAAIGNNFFLLGYPQIGLSLGFDEVDDVRHPVEDSPAITRAATQFLRKNKDRSFFLQLHYDAPHWPYSPPAQYLTSVPSEQVARLMGLPSTASKAPAASVTPAASSTVALDSNARAYLAEAAYADAQVAQVLDELQKLGLRERTLVIVVGDHGEVFDPQHNHYVMALKQPTLYHHGWSAYDEILRVPLLLGMPGRLPGGVTVREQVRLTDVAPTVLEVLDLVGKRPQLPGGERATGSSLLPLMQGEKEKLERPAFVEGQNVRALRASGYLYLRRSDPRLQKARENSGVGAVQAVPEELYDLQKDPQQHHNLLLGTPSPQMAQVLVAMRTQFLQNAPQLPDAKMPITHLQLAASAGTRRELTGTILSSDPQLSVAGVQGGEVSPLGPGRLEVTLRSGGRVDLAVDADAKLELQLTLDGLPLAKELLLLGPYSLPLLVGAADADKREAVAPAASPVATPASPPSVESATSPERSLVIGGAVLSRLSAAYAPVAGEHGDVLLWRDQASPGALAPTLSRSTQATQGEVSTMMRDWGYAQPAAPAGGDKATASSAASASAPAPPSGPKSPP